MSMKPGRGTREVGDGIELEIKMKKRNYNKNLIQLFPNGAFHGQTKKTTAKTTGRRQTSWLFTNVAEELLLGLPGTTPASAQNGT